MALVTASPLLVRAAGGASLIYGLPHLLYHATHLKPFDAGDAVAIVVALSVAVLAAAAALEARFPGEELTSGRTAPPPG
jgi:hypothetical protein